MPIKNIKQTGTGIRREKETDRAKKWGKKT